MPEPQRSLAAMLPLSGLPPDWTVGKSGDKHLETFNADNLYEKIDGRAESFLQYGVKGMAYAFYHPAGDPSNELQVYIFEMADPLKALGKYGSEKPEEFQAVHVGDQGYTTAGSTLFYSGQVLHADRLDPGRSQVRRLRAGPGQAGRREAEARRRRIVRAPHRLPRPPQAERRPHSRDCGVRRRPGRPPRPSRLPRR